MRPVPPQQTFTRTNRVTLKETFIIAPSAFSGSSRLVNSWSTEPGQRP
jgi:hypothetical protein